jgi:fibronectin-binding autotransporter adhesin
LTHIFADRRGALLVDVRDFRGSLLTTSSALALLVGLGGTAWAQCAFVNSPGAGGTLTTSGVNNCVVYDNGATTTVNVINNGTLNASGPYPPNNPGTATGIAVIKSGTVLNGSITNNGSITVSRDGINIGEGAIPSGNGNDGATVTGSIINNTTITGESVAGIVVVGSLVGGSISNALGATISEPGGAIGIYVSGVTSNHTAIIKAASVVGSVVNNGTITTGSDAGINVSVAIVGGVTNTGSITGAGFSDIGVVNGGTVTGSIVNTGSLVDNNAGDNVPLYIGGQSIGGSVSNSGTISGGFGIAITDNVLTGGRQNVVAGNVINSGSITAHSKTGLDIKNATIGGTILNSGSIVAAKVGILVWNTVGTVAGATVAGGITNSGSISITGTGIGGVGAAGIALAGASISQGVTNAASAIIAAPNGAGIYVGNMRGTTTTISSSVVGGILNQGTINAKTGIIVVAGSAITGGISNTGTISASGMGISLAVAGVSIFDSGIITGGGGTAIQFGPGTNTLTLGPGFSITGNVLGAGSDSFQLGGAGNGSFNLGSIGSQYTGFGTFGVIGATWAATGANGGNWSISNGATLQLGNGAASGLITGNLADGGVLSFNEPSGSTVTVPGVISGTGSLTQVGPGTVVLSGSNSYSGGTTLTAGTLQVTNGSSVGTGAVTLNGGAFQSGAAGLSFADNFAINTPGGTIDTQANTLTLSGSIANGNGTTGPLNKVGSGTLILTGMSSYTGPTNVNAGTLQAGANNVFSPGSAFNIASGALLVFNNFNETLGSLGGAGGVTLGTGALTLADASGVFSGAITGSGTFTLQAGSETLTGNDSGFTGTAVLTGGNFIVGTATSPGAVFGGSVTVQNGGTLSGHGTILGGINNAGGTVSPGGSVGRLSVGGNYVQGANGTLAIQLTPAAASQLAVQGSASLAGTLAAMPSAGLYVPTTKYPILTAGGGVSGTFGTFTNTLPSLNLTISYLSNEVDLVVGGFAGQTRNQIAVANALNLGLGTATGDFATALTAVAALQPSQLPQTLSSLGGQIYANLGEVSLQDRRLFLGAMDERMRLLDGGSPGAATLGGLVPGGWGSNANAMQMAALGSALGDRGPQVAQAVGTAPGAPALPNNVWARGFGQFGSLDSNKGALGADYSTGGGAIGTEIIRTPGSLLGLAISGGQSSVSTQSLPENGTVSFVQFGVYGAQAYDYGLMADGALVYAHDFYDVSRGLVGLGRTATSSHGGNDAALDVGVSRPMQVDAWRITPRVGLSYFHIGQSSFAENGANSLDLSVSPTAIDALRSRVGVTISQPMMLGGSQILPELRAAWTHDFLDDRGVIGAAFAGAPGVGFTQIGAATGRDAADLGVGVSFAVAQTAVRGQLSAFLQYDATLAAHQTSNAVAGGLKLTW